MPNTKLWDHLMSELRKAKDENLEKAEPLNKHPKENDIKDAIKNPSIIDPSTGKTPKPLFLHSSHNSHGDWGKHWAHGGYEDDEPMDHLTTPPGFKP